jgi:hypothetical protein
MAWRETPRRQASLPVARPASLCDHMGMDEFTEAFKKEPPPVVFGG